MVGLHPPEAVTGSPNACLRSVSGSWAASVRGIDGRPYQKSRFIVGLGIIAGPIVINGLVHPGSADLEEWRGDGTRGQGWFGCLMSSGFHRSGCDIHRRSRAWGQDHGEELEVHVLLEVDTSAPGLDVSWTLPRLWVTLAIGISGGTAGLQLFDCGGCSLGRVACGQEATHVTRVCICNGDSLGGLWPRVGCMTQRDQVHLMNLRKLESRRLLQCDGQTDGWR